MSAGTVITCDFPNLTGDMSTPKQIHLTMSNKTSNNIYQKQAQMICLVFPQEYIYITRDYASFEVITQKSHDQCVPVEERWLTRYV